MLNRTNNGTVLNRDKRIYHITTEATTRSHINIKIHHHSKKEVSNNPTRAGDMKSPDLYRYQKIISIVLTPFFDTRQDRCWNGEGCRFGRYQRIRYEDRPMMPLPMRILLTGGIARFAQIPVESCFDLVCFYLGSLFLLRQVMYLP